MTALVSPGVGAAPGPDPEPDPGKPKRSRRSLLTVTLTTIPVLVAAGAVYIIVTHKFMPQPERTTYQVPAVFNLREGDCFNLSQNDGSVSLLPCTVPHDSEVFGTFSLPDSAWPGVDAVQSQADAGCASRLAGYLGTSVTPSSLSRNATYPDPVTWASGVRTVVCTIGSADGGKTTGSFRDAIPSPVVPSPAANGALAPSGPGLAPPSAG